MSAALRRIQYVAPFDGAVDDILAHFGASSSVRVALRKRLGTVCFVSDGRESALRLVDKLNRGDKFCIYLQDDDIKAVPKWDARVNIVYEDEDLAVIDKSAGMAVIPVKGHYGRSLANALANIWGDFVYRPINRLDRDTSGLMLVAKNQLAHGILSRSHIKRQYVGLCQGVFAGDVKGKLDLPIKSSSDGFKRYVEEGGKRAVTHYEILRQYDGYFSAKFELETGRTHQIRTHISHIGYPLCCDRLYNCDPHPIICPNGMQLDRQALHSCLLEFIHPIENKKMSFVSQAEFI